MLQCLLKCTNVRLSGGLDLLLPHWLLLQAYHKQEDVAEGQEALPENWQGGRGPRGARLRA